MNSNSQLSTLNSQLILGIDPGTTVMGAALLEVTNGNAALKAMTTLSFKDCADHYQKLAKIEKFVSEVIEAYKPDALAIESPFFGKNVQSMLKLGRAQGVAIAVAVNKGLNVHEYSPLKIKMAITGNGASSKEQVAGMLKRFLHIDADRMQVKLDATDALAAAYCHYLQLRVPTSTATHYKSWKEFTTKNSERVK